MKRTMEAIVELKADGNYANIRICNEPDKILFSTTIPLTPDIIGKIIKLSGQNKLKTTKQGIMGNDLESYNIQLEIDNADLLFEEIDICYNIMLNCDFLAEQYFFYKNERLFDIIIEVTNTGERPANKIQIIDDSQNIIKTINNYGFTKDESKMIFEKYANFKESSLNYGNGSIELIIKDVKFENSIIALKGMTVFDVHLDFINNKFSFINRIHEQVIYKELRTVKAVADIENDEPDGNGVLFPKGVIQKAVERLNGRLVPVFESYNKDKKIGDAVLSWDYEDRRLDCEIKLEPGVKPEYINGYYAGCCYKSSLSVGVDVSKLNCDKTKSAGKVMMVGDDLQIVSVGIIEKHVDPLIPPININSEVENGKN